MFLQNGAMLVNERLKNMEKKEFEIMKKALYSKNEQVWFWNLIDNFIFFSLFYL